MLYLRCYARFEIYSLSRLTRGEIDRGIGETAVSKLCWFYRCYRGRSPLHYVREKILHNDAMELSSAVVKGWSNMCRGHGILTIQQRATVHQEDIWKNGLPFFLPPRVILKFKLLLLFCSYWSPFIIFIVYLLVQRRTTRRN
jgi:hypothetical protein